MVQDFVLRQFSKQTYIRYFDKRNKRNIFCKYKKAKQDFASKLNFTCEFNGELLKDDGLFSTKTQTENQSTETDESLIHVRVQIL